ncbi:RagB/SusD family nutrient uptake outer membrane protein [Chitinophaga agrisoli]|nr:RagB/SusD family nutrient uptake outer membrane protein [Chitinophaga agrisoli]
MKQYAHRLILPLLIILVSCKKDFMNTPPGDKAVTTEYINSLAACDELLNGVYLKLSNPFYTGLNNIVYAEVISDNAKPKTGASQLNAPYLWSMTTSMSVSTSNSGLEMNSTWASGYAVLRQLAYVLENVDKYRSEDTKKADNIKAQALAIRALVHYQLVNVFAQPYFFTPDASHPGIPYVIASDYSLAIKRSSVADVYKNMIADLNDAIPLFAGENKKVVMNKNAARALLSRLYLFKRDYVDAVGLSLQVLAEVPLMMNTTSLPTNYPHNLFTDNESEALFQLTPLAIGINASVSTSYAGYYFNSTNPIFYATADVADLLAEYAQDLRNEWVKKSGDNWIITKFPKGVVAGFSDPSKSHYQTLLRSSEMCLTAAECYCSLNKEDSARYYLNLIRERVGVPIVNATGVALTDSIAKERRKELCFEGIRMYDLLRAGKSIYRKDATNPLAVTLPYPSNKAIAPLPLTETQLNGLEQNVGY